MTKRPGAGLGANAFYYQQITGDSASGATLGDFQGRTVGVGAVISCIRTIGTATVAAEVKWLPELDTGHRLKGIISGLSGVGVLNGSAAKTHL